jgi:hypothetical protein
MPGPNPTRTNIKGILNFCPASASTVFHPLRSSGTTESPEALGLMEELVKEYDINWDNSLPEEAQCIGFVRGYGSAIKW